MTSLFMFSAEGVAGTESRFRTGARHALMTFVASDDIENAQRHATRYATEKGWTFFTVKRGKEIATDTSLIDDGPLRSAAVDAQRNGAAIVVYTDEIPTDA